MHQRVALAVMLAGLAALPARADWFKIDNQEAKDICLIPDDLFDHPIVLAPGICRYFRFHSFQQVLIIYQTEDGAVGQKQFNAADIRHAGPMARSRFEGGKYCVSRNGLLPLSAKDAQETGEPGGADHPLHD